jgi:pentalenene oxygenase
MSDTSRPRQVPGALPVLGHAAAIGRKPFQFLRALPDWGDIVTIRVGPQRVFAVCHPDLVHGVLTDGRTFDKGGQIFDKARQVVGNGLVTCSHGEHQRQRRQVQPAFTRDRISQYARLMSEEIGAALAEWRANQVINAPVETHRIAARITARALFSVDLGPTDVRDVIQATQEIERGMFQRVLLPFGLGERIPGPARRRYTAAQATLDSIVVSLVNEYQHGGIDHGDVLSALLAVGADDDQDRLNSAELHDQVLTLLVSGIETTANAVAWALHLVSTTPELAQRLRDEAALGGAVATWEDLPRLGLATAILTEALRLYPPVWILTRKVTRDVELGGYSIPAGSTLLLSPVSVHYRSATYSDPGQFDPDRWLDDRAASYPRGSFVPFGGGARKCIGEHFGMTEATLALASIVDRWQLTPAPGRPVRIARKVVLTPRTVPLIVDRRLPSIA